LGYLTKKAILILEKNGYGVIHPSQHHSDMEDEFFEIWKNVEKFTMISIERGYNIYKSVEYIVNNGIEGDFVECGVWKGGACMIAAKALLEFGVRERKIVLYDTFSGMTRPSEHDCVAWTGSNMLQRWIESRNKKGENLWSAGLDEVRQNIYSTGYPEEKIVFNAGDVCEVLDNKKNTPASISLLRLDTDWYESTKKELQVLFPLLVKGGILIIDDFGHFTGARKAVQEYFSGTDFSIYLDRIDYTGRCGVKI
jgi:hypothetical protein